MGSMVKFSCTNCGYDVELSLGDGMMSAMANCKARGEAPDMFKNTFFWEIAAPAYSLEAAKNGEYGVDIQKFLQENPNHYINRESVVAICSNCGAVEKTTDFTFLNKGHYLTREKHFQKCSKCGGDAEIFDERSIKHAICPKCHKKIDAQFVGLWD